MWIKPSFGRQTGETVHEPRAALSPGTFSGSVASRLEPSPVRIRGLSISTL